MIRSLTAVLLAACIASPVLAKVPESEAQKLKDGTLTPLGGEAKANKEGTIPAYTGGLKTAPASWAGPGKRLVDPFPDDKPLFFINAANLAQHKSKLTPGQIKLIERAAATYKMPVYATRRVQYNAAYINEATYQNALKAELADGSDALQNAAMGTPFPIPKTGAEAIWNHKLRHTGYIFRRWNSQLVATADGYTETRSREDNYAPYIEPGMTAEKLGELMAIYFMQTVKAPARVAGTINLGLSPMDQKKAPQMVWQYNPGQKRVRRAPAVAYDAPDPGTDGLTTVDQIDLFNGPLDRYNWKLIGKKEIYAPYNSYRMHSDQVKYKQLMLPTHISPEFTRYELHRVWVIEASLKPGTSHIYAKRVFFLDEDSWGIMAVDLYDSRGQLWKLQESHPVMYYDPKDPHPISAAELVYDLQSGRYAAQALSNEADEYKDMVFKKNYFTEGNMEKVGGGG